jgi:Tfp pilus assembly protein PilV
MARMIEMPKRRGFMLADVVVAAVILAIAFGAVVGTIGYAMKMGLYQRDRAAVYDVLEEFVASLDMTGKIGEVTWPVVVDGYEIRGSEPIILTNTAGISLHAITIYVPTYNNVTGSSSSPIKFLISPDL